MADHGGKPRPFRLDDVPAVNRLHRAVWWGERSPEGWNWLADNPAHPADVPLGWVIDGKTGPAAFVGLFVQRLWRGQEVRHVATGFSLVVSDTARGAAPRLIRTVMNTPGMAATHTLNANAQAAVLYRRMRLEPLPHGSSDVKLTWIVDPAAALYGRLVREVAVRRRYKGVLGNERLLNRRLGRALPVTTPGVERLTDLSDDGPLAGFWQALKAQGRWIAERSPEAVRWRAANPDLAIAPLCLGYRRDGEISGWLFAQMSKASEIEVPILDIVDLVALDGEPDALPALMNAVLKGARGMGAAKVRLQVVSPELLSRLGPLAARARREGGWGHGFAHLASDLAKALRAEWSPTPWDGDHSLCLRSPPL